MKEKRGLVIRSEQSTATTSVLNISGRPQIHGLYNIPENKWTRIPKDLADRLVSDPNYIVGAWGMENATGYPHVLLWTANDVFYSGGRYYNHQMAVNLARCGCKVTISTNRYPCFLPDFEAYGGQEHIRWILREPTAEDGPFDLVIATPFEDTIYAQAFAEEHGIPCAGVIYETPDWLHKYEPANTQFRTPTSLREVEALKKCDYIIALSEIGRQEAHKWLGTPLDRIFIVNPALNNLACDEAKPIEKGKRPLVVFTGRLAGRKCWEKFLDTCLAMEEEFDIAVIGGNPALKNIGYTGSCAHEIRWYNRISDAEKFAVMKAADLFVVPSRFEGYGIVPGEALYCGKPCVVFDLPVLREVYGDRLVYAKWMDWDDLRRKIANLLNDRRIFAASKSNCIHRIDSEFHLRYSMDAQRSTLRNLPFIPFKYRQPSDIKLSFCMIAFNVADWIKPCLDAIYDEAHEIIIVEGAVEWWQKYAKPDGRSTDGTSKAILSYPDPAGKIKYSYGKFPTKLEMRRKTVEQITGTHYWLLDPDEIWQGVACMRQAIFENQDKEVFHTLPMHFWHDPWHVATGGIWDMRHLRVCEWKPGHKYVHHTNPHDADGNMVHEKEPAYKAKSMRVDGCVRYHYGMALCDPEDVRRKVEYYAWRDRESNPADVRQKLEWLDWHEGTPMSDGVVIKRFYGRHPAEVGALFVGKGIDEPKWRREQRSDGHSTG